MRWRDVIDTRVAAHGRDSGLSGVWQGVLICEVVELGVLACRAATTVDVEPNDAREREENHAAYDRTHDCADMRLVRPGAGWIIWNRAAASLFVNGENDGFLRQAAGYPSLLHGGMTKTEDILEGEECIHRSHRCTSDTHE